MDLWSGSARGELVPLLGKLPLAPTAPSMLALGRTLLLTRAEAPTGDSPEAFLTVRLKKLLEAGYVEEAGAIAATAIVPDDPAFARVQADAILLSGRADAACSDATATRLTSDEPFWIELRAYCYAVAGDGAMYDLTRQVMDAQNLSDGAFDILLDDVRNGAKDAPKPIDNPTALHVFLTEQAGLPVDPAMRSKAGAGTLFNADAAVTSRINELALHSDATSRAAYDLVVPSPDHAAFTQKILVQLVNAAPPESAYAALILGLYSELGEPLPPEAQVRAGTVEATDWPGRRPAPMLMERIEAARGQPGRHGEALLALLVAVGDAGPGDLSPNVTLQFVRVLKEIGPPGAARAFAQGRGFVLSPVLMPARTSIGTANAALIEAFLDMMSAERGASANTLAAYRRDLLDFAAHAAKKDATLKNASREVVKSHLASLSAGGAAASSQSRKLSALRQFFAFLYNEGRRSDDPTGALEAPTRARSLPKILSQEDVLRLIAEARKQSETPEGLRLLCIVELLYASGPARHRAGLAPARRRQGARRLHPRPWQGQQGAPRAAQPRRADRHRQLPRQARRIPPEGREGKPLPFPLARRGRPSHPPPLPPASQTARRRRRP